MDHSLVITQRNMVEDLLRNGYDTRTIKFKIPAVTDEIISMAKGAIKNKKENKVSPMYLFTEGDLRFCTHQQVARWRAKKLACDIIIDVGCGIGIQAIEFAKTCKKVIAIDGDQKKIERAKLNAKIVGVSNIEYIHNDALKALDTIKRADTIFWDPERPESEVKRSVSSLKPAYDQFVIKAEKITKRLAIEFPPQMDRDLPPWGEWEYISLGKESARLTFYQQLSGHKGITVVALPSEETVHYDPSAKAQACSLPEHFIYEVDDVLQKAGCLDTLNCVLGTKKMMMGKKVYVTSDFPVKSAFVRSYTIEDQTNEREISSWLAKRGFGKVVLHGDIDSGQYAEKRKRIQQSLKGEKTAHLFFSDDQVWITESVK